MDRLISEMTYIQLKVKLTLLIYSVIHMYCFSLHSLSRCVFDCVLSFVYRENSPYVRNVLSLSNMVVERGL